MTTSGPQETQNERSRRRQSMFAPLSNTQDPIMRSQSPASTIFSSSVPAQRSATDPPVHNLREFSTLPSRRALIKADFTITTSFDPGDAELYALWGPVKR